MSEADRRTVGLVRNPLTLIAVFASVAEVAATMALPQLPEPMQDIFVWFVMAFPTLLVSVFFCILWQKHHVLYAPSDFSDETNFMTSLRPATLEETLGGIESSANDEPAPQEKEKNDQKPDDLPPASSERISRTDFQFLESIAIQKISSEERLNFVRNMRLDGGHDVLFDAIAETPEKVVGLEVVYSRYPKFARSRITRLKSLAYNFSVQLPKSKKKASAFIVVIISDGLSSANKKSLRNQIDKLASDWRLPVQIDTRIIDKQSLEVKGKP